MRELIEQTKLAVPVFTYAVTASAERPVTLQIDGALGSDVIVVTGAGVVGTDETVIYDSSGTVLQFIAATPIISFYAPVRLAITKPSTTNAVGLMELTTVASGTVLRKTVMLDGLVMHDDLRMM
jgi:hypothetical protein